jgi:hypothetical protein
MRWWALLVALLAIPATMALLAVAFVIMMFAYGGST